MSDPMTNTEVEDVLASIRRLVSDDKRPEAKPALKPPSDRLVLTPSLRVKDDEVDAQPRAETGDEADGDDTGLSDFARTALSDPTAPEGTSEPADDLPYDNGDETFEEEGTPGTADEPPCNDGDAALASSEGSGWADASPRDQADETFGDEEAHFDAVNAADAADQVLVLADHDAIGAEHAREAEPEQFAAPQHAGDAASADMGADAADIAGSVVVPEGWADNAGADAADEPTPQQDTEPQLQEAMADAAPSETRTESAAQTLSEKIAALEMLVGKRSDRFEPDDPGADAYAGTEQPAMAWEDADDVDPAPLDGPFVADKPRRDDDRPAQIFASDEDVLDEEALRELVSDIVREELQGALGERITRNVRKLVRREIHRALAAQELE